VKSISSIEENMPDVKESLPVTSVVPETTASVSMTHDSEAHDHEDHKHGFVFRPAI